MIPCGQPVRRPFGEGDGFRAVGVYEKRDGGHGRVY